MWTNWLFEHVLTWDLFWDLGFFSVATAKKMLAVALVVVVICLGVDGLHRLTHHPHGVTPSIVRPQPAG